MSQKALVRSNSSISYLQQEKRKSSNPIPPVNSVYEDLTKTELVKVAKSKDKLIEELRDALKNHTDKDREKISMYRRRLEEQIAHNQKTVKVFESITETVVEIINKYKFLDQNTRETVVNTVGAIRDSCGRPNKQIEKEFEQDDEFSCVQQIAEETAKLLEYLSKLTDQNVIRLKSELARTKGKEKNPEVGQQIKMLKQEVKELMLENRSLSKLLQLNESEKNRLLMSISSAVTEKMVDQLQKLTIVQLIEQIKKLILRIKQLQFDKEEIFRRTLLEKELNQKKYIDLLKEVKQIKTRKKRVVEVQ